MKGSIMSFIVFLLIIMQLPLAKVYADNSKLTTQDDDNGMPYTDFDGFYVVGESYGFESFDDFIQNRDKAFEWGDWTTSTDTHYLSDYDYIYVPFLDNPISSITDIRIEPECCIISFNYENSTSRLCYYYGNDNKSECYLYTYVAVPYGHKKTINGTDYYLYNGNYYYIYNGKYFSFSSSLMNDSMGINLTKVFLDNHFSEIDGKLYYINDNGEKESGWKNIGNHKYYFRSSDKAAICGKTAKIGGIVYRFNANGVCKGKYTGYAKVNGKKVYYKNGVAA